MIANISQFSSIAPFLQYNKNKVLNGEATELDFGGDLYKKEAKYAESLIASFGYNVKSNRKDKFLHVSLNFLPEDNGVLDDTILKDIVKDYLSGIGFSADHPYIVYKHNDTVHPHVHIVTSKIDENGKCIVNANNYRQSQRVTRELEIKHKLIKVSSHKVHAVVNQKLSYAPSLVEKLNFHIKYALESLLVENMAQFIVYLNDNYLDLQLMQVGGFVDDKKPVINGLVFNNLTTNFLQSQKGIKASSLYLKPTMTNLESIFLKNKEIKQSHKMDIKKVLDEAFAKYEQLTLIDLEKLLIANNINSNFKSDRSNQLVGVCFRKNNTVINYSGEQIGKKYTARNLSVIIGDKTILKSKIKLQNSIRKKELTQIPTRNSNSMIKDDILDLSALRVISENDLDVFQTQVSEDVQEDHSISDIDKKKKLDPVKRRKRRL
ncbi:relaxase/mobilization nuclease domain-containing protein [Flavobacterium sp.]|uniref:relaxase/mobilization nuclease domain-containing protein n=1 Tax=Flavobacterium sp. TaxID=239 RepID=UPI002623322D|nr:relaxase/mobilization nuclease domain-containing protein [Flavobacterium sp.]MDG2433139.1 relaxase/mobilization nuclease domain-containing protein [Flavobacterium sp.]